MWEKSPLAKFLNLLTMAGYLAVEFFGLALIPGWFMCCIHTVFSLWTKLPEISILQKMQHKFSWTLWCISFMPEAPMCLKICMCVIYELCCPSVRVPAVLLEKQSVHVGKALLCELHLDRSLPLSLYASLSHSFSVCREVSLGRHSWHWYWRNIGGGDSRKVKLRQEKENSQKERKSHTAIERKAENIIRQLLNTFLKTPPLKKWENTLSQRQECQNTNRQERAPWE